MNKVFEVPIKKGNVSTIETHYTYDPLDFDYLPSITLETDREMRVEYRKINEIYEVKPNKEYIKLVNSSEFSKFDTPVNRHLLFNKSLPMSFTYGKETINKEQISGKMFSWFTKLFDK
jgi:hypothetical protein